MIDIAVNLWIGASIVFSSIYRRSPTLMLILPVALAVGGIVCLGMGTPLWAHILGHGVAITNDIVFIFHPKTRYGEWIQKKLQKRKLQR